MREYLLIAIIAASVIGVIGIIIVAVRNYLIWIRWRNNYHSQDSKLRNEHLNRPKFLRRSSDAPDGNERKIFHRRATDKSGSQPEPSGRRGSDRADGNDRGNS